MIRPKVAALLTAPALALASLALLAPAAQAAAPGNDDFASAAPLSGLGVSVRGTLSGSTTQPDERGPSLTAASSGGSAGDLEGAGSVWYRWTAPASVPVGLSLNAGAVQMVTVWSGSGLSTLTELSSGMSLGLPGVGIGMNAGFSAAAGTTYFFQVLGSPVAEREEASDGGAFTLSVEQGSISGVSAATVTRGLDDDASPTIFSAMAAVDISLADGLFDKINDVLGATGAGEPIGSTDPTDILGSFGDVPAGSFALGITDGRGSYVLSGLRPGAQYLVFGISFSQTPGATVEDAPSVRITGLFYPGTQNPLRYTPLSGPAAGCSYVGLDVDFAANKMAAPRLTCPLAPTCQQAKAAAPSPAAVTSAEATVTQATSAAAKASKDLTKAKNKAKKAKKKAPKSHAAVKLAKKVKKLSKNAKTLSAKVEGSKTTAATLHAAAAAVGAACKPL